MSGVSNILAEFDNLPYNVFKPQRLYSIIQTAVYTLNLHFYLRVKGAAIPAQKCISSKGLWDAHKA